MECWNLYKGNKNNAKLIKKRALLTVTWFPSLSSISCIILRRIDVNILCVYSIRPFKRHN